LQSGAREALGSFPQKAGAKHPPFPESGASVLLFPEEGRQQLFTPAFRPGLIAPLKAARITLAAHSVAALLGIRGIMKKKACQPDNTGINFIPVTWTLIAISALTSGLISVLACAGCLYAGILVANKTFTRQLESVTDDVTAITDRFNRFQKRRAADTANDNRAVKDRAEELLALGERAVKRPQQRPVVNMPWAKGA